MRENTTTRRSGRDDEDDAEKLLLTGVRLGNSGRVRAPFY
jgi:hypothetical protein